MKYLLLLLLSTPAFAQRSINQDSAAMVAILDSIDNYPKLYAAQLYHRDTLISKFDCMIDPYKPITYSCSDVFMCKLKSIAHRFAGFKREGIDVFGRHHILLYNRVYTCKYGYVVNDKPRDNIDALKTANIKSITIITDKPGVWISHWGCEYLIIIHTK